MTARHLPIFCGCWRRGPWGRSTYGSKAGTAAPLRSIGCGRAAQGRPLPQTRPAEFYRRRAARLLPAYYASLLFSLALAVHRSGWSRALAVDLFTHLTLTQQLFPACYIGTQLNAVSWTLTVFALFYLVFPLLAPLCARHPLPVLGTLTVTAAGQEG